MRQMRGSLLAWALTATAAAGCSGSPAVCIGDACPDDGPAAPPAATSFETDLPGSNQGQAGTPSGPSRSGGEATVGAAAPTAPPTTATNAGANDSSSGNASEAARAIAEADIIQLQGNTLFALSRVAGLAVVDVSNPDALKILGRYRELPAEPFELYIRDGVALVMFTGWGQYVKVDDGYSYVTTSKLLALDVKDPANITELGNFDVAGSISDSRMVGDVLYIVGYEQGYCYRCSEKPRTTITSLSVADPRHVEKIDELFYTSPDGSSSWQKSITVTDRRMYVSGPEYSDKPIGSTVQVVDISDPAGDLVEGAKVQVTGQVSSRWQMDEYAGVLRVLSQPQQWWTANTTTTPKPVLETFKIESSNTLSPLGQLTLQIPEREVLQSARFDGERGYAITAERTDPLIALDLSDPAAPRQAGEVKIPGFIWHMEPRGERLLGVGFEQGAAAGGLSVALFDVKDLDKPALLSRVNFGGSWGQLPADQDRAHKVFRVFDEAGLILVPFSGWNSFDVSRPDCGGERAVGGVQLIDFANDTLKVRGAAQVVGQARRALLHGGDVIAVSDERVQAFDIANRDAPKETSKVVLARQVSQAYQLDNAVVARFSYDGYSGLPLIDFVDASRAGDANESRSELNLADALGAGSNGCKSESFSVDQVFVKGSQLDVLYQHNAYNTLSGVSVQQRGIAIIDASQPAAPKLVSKTQWTEGENWSPYFGYYSYGSYYNTGNSVVRTEHAIVALESSWTYTQVSSSQRTRLRVIDLRDPANVKTSALPLEEVALFSGLIVDGDTVLTSHMTVNEKTPDKARFYIDRFDVSDPSAPRRLESINVPGALMHYDAATQHAITTEQKRQPSAQLTYQECYERFAFADWNTPSNGTAVSGGAPSSAPRAAGGSSDSASVPTPPQPVGTCVGYKQNLYLVKLNGTSATLADTVTLADDQQVSGSAMGNGVIFANVGRGRYYGRGGVVPPIATAAVDCAGPCGGWGIAQPQKPSQLLVLGGFADGKFDVGTLSVEHADAANSWWGFWGTSGVYAYGSRALLVGQTDAVVVDGSNPAAPAITERIELIAYPRYVDLRDKTALVTLGAQGVQWIELD